VAKLLLAFDGLAQTLLMGPEQTARCAANIANLDIANWADRYQLHRILKG
jgi:hypothetical protein